MLADARWCGVHGIGRFASEVLARLGGVQKVPESLPLLHPLESPWLGFQVHHFNPSVYFSPGFNPPVPCRRPLVFTIHDLIHLRTAQSTFAKRMYYASIVMAGAKRAATILTVSEASRAEILEWTGLDAERVVVVSNGVSSVFRPHGRRYTLQPYFLFVGCLKPHKNVPRILEAFGRSSLRREFRLLMTGQPTAVISRRIASLGLSDRVQFVGTVADESLACLYRGAAALVVPSLSEGFCLPALEAMACGCPVVGSSQGAQRELLQEAGVYADPESIESIASAMESATCGSTRERVIDVGLTRSSRYSWDTTAAKISEILMRAAQSGERQ